ncbi:3637_t:CDS:2 [Acaulospora morrowiae]|uniref:3637_t:CDS:1 n=1 Tax=Acaulospora morrowiae TaxID=94023 RepID=A0A9N9A5V4_9GLOM|nr:3637_t:CDS:2 [Acaulospora morrowiae]
MPGILMRKKSRNPVIPKEDNVLGKLMDLLPLSKVRNRADLSDQKYHLQQDQKVECV